eukprot:evm.model.scf_111.5 EVM.evm.TU.scf_111.5   scf_111:93270-102159(-)
MVLDFWKADQLSAGTADGDVVMGDADAMDIAGSDEDACEMHTRIYQTLAEKCKERDVKYVSFALGLDGDTAEESGALLTFMKTIVDDEERRTMVVSSGCTTLYTYYARWNAFLLYLYLNDPLQSTQYINSDNAKDFVIHASKHGSLWGNKTPSYASVRLGEVEFHGFAQPANPVDPSDCQMTVSVLGILVASLHRFAEFQSMVRGRINRDVELWRVLEVKELRKTLLRRRTKQRHEDMVDRQMKVPHSDFLPSLNRDMCLELFKAGAREDILHRALTAMMYQSLWRFQKTTFCTFADLFCFHYPEGFQQLGDGGMMTVYIVCDGGKTNKNNRCQADCVVRSKDVYGCPVGSLVDWMFQKVHVNGERLPNPIEKKEDFYNDPIFTGSTYAKERNRRLKLYKTLEVTMSATLHVDRRHGAVAQTIAG